MHRSFFLLTVLALCTLATCGIIPFFGSSGLGEHFENSKRRQCRKEEQSRCLKECSRITKKIAVRCYEPETMYCYCKTKNRVPSFQDFKGFLGIDDGENAPQMDAPEFRGCRVKSAKGACE